MVNGASLFPEATLNIGYQMVGLQEPNKPIIDHPFHGFTDATG